MNKRFILYIMVSATFTLWYWYAPFWSTYLPPLPPNWNWLPYLIWVLPALGIAVFEVRRSHKAHMAAYAMTLFWTVAILLYYVYYVFVVIPPFSTPHWIMDAFSFFLGAPLQKIIRWEAISIIGGMLGGYMTGWFYLNMSKYRGK